MALRSMHEHDVCTRTKRTSTVATVADVGIHLSSQLETSCAIRNAISQSSLPFFDPRLDRRASTRAGHAMRSSWLHVLECALLLAATAHAAVFQQLNASRPAEALTELVPCPSTVLLTRDDTRAPANERINMSYAHALTTHVGALHAWRSPPKRRVRQPRWRTNSDARVACRWALARPYKLPTGATACTNYT